MIGRLLLTRSVMRGSVSNDAVPRPPSSKPTISAGPTPVSRARYQWPNAISGSLRPSTLSSVAWRIASGRVRVRSLAVPMSRMLCSLTEGTARSIRILASLIVSKSESVSNAMIERSPLMRSASVPPRNSSPITGFAPAMSRSLISTRDRFISSDTIFRISVSLLPILDSDSFLTLFSIHFSSGCFKIKSIVSGSVRCAMMFMALPLVRL